MAGSSIDSQKQFDDFISPALEQDKQFKQMIANKGHHKEFNTKLGGLPQLVLEAKNALMALATKDMKPFMASLSDSSKLKPYLKAKISMADGSSKKLGYNLFWYVTEGTVASEPFTKYFVARHGGKHTVFAEIAAFEALLVARASKPVGKVLTKDIISRIGRLDLVSCLRLSIKKDSVLYVKLGGLNQVKIKTMLKTVVKAEIAENLGKLVDAIGDDAKRKLLKKKIEKIRLIDSKEFAFQQNFAILWNDSLAKAKLKGQPAVWKQTISNLLFDTCGEEEYTKYGFTMTPTSVRIP